GRLTRNTVVRLFVCGCRRAFIPSLVHPVSVSSKETSCVSRPDRAGQTRSSAGMQPSTPPSPGSPRQLEAAADPSPIPKPTAISQRSLGSSGVRKASHTVPVSPCHPPEYTTWSTVDTRPLRSQPPAQRRLRFSTSCSWPYPDLRLAFPGPLVTELDTAAPLLASTGKWAEIVARRRTPGPTGPTTSLTRNRIPVYCTDTEPLHLPTPRTIHIELSRCSVGPG